LLEILLVILLDFEKEVSIGIFDTYTNDFIKDTTVSLIMKNKVCNTSIVNQLLKEKNFKYSLVEKGKDSRYFDFAINWLILVGYLYQFMKMILYLSCI